jgi:hypothetical protein
MCCLHDDDMVKHITEMQRLKEALDSMGTPLDDAQFTAYIKASLPDKFRPLLTTIARPAGGIIYWEEAASLRIAR